MATPFLDEADGLLAQLGGHVTYHHPRCTDRTHGPDTSCAVTRITGVLCQVCNRNTSHESGLCHSHRTMAPGTRAIRVRDDRDMLRHLDPGNYDLRLTGVDFEYNTVPSDFRGSFAETMPGTYRIQVEGEIMPRGR